VVLKHDHVTATCLPTVLAGKSFFCGFNSWRGVERHKALFDESEYAR
jgi:hypothetical protein